MALTERFVRQLRSEFQIPADVPIAPETRFSDLIGAEQQGTFEQLQQRLAVLIGTTPDRAAEFFDKGMESDSIAKMGPNSGEPGTVLRLSAMIEHIHTNAMPDNGSD